MIYILLADGFEEIEALTVVDFVRRSNLSIQIVSTMNSLEVIGAHGIKVVADALLKEISLTDPELIVLPGGLPGATNLRKNAMVTNCLIEQAKNDGMIAAICAAPYILGELGLLKGKKATCYPGFESHLLGANYTGNLVECDGNIITGKGPAAAFLFATQIIEALQGKETRMRIEKETLIG